MLSQFAEKERKRPHSVVKIYSPEAEFYSMMALSYHTQLY